MDSIADVLAYLRSRAAAVRPGQWIVLEQVFITRLRERRFPTRQELDEAAPHNPVFFCTGPDAALNSLALKLCGIDKDFQITDGLAGRVERDPQDGRADRHPAQLRPVRQVPAVVEDPGRRRPPRASAELCWPPTTRWA